MSIPSEVRFENSATASTHPGSVEVVVPLDAQLDPRSFRLGDISLGDIRVHIPDDRATYQGDFDFTQSKGFILRLTAGVDIQQSVATWLFEAIDPITGEVIRDTTKGLLAPNNAQGIGLGTVGYTIQPRESALTGDSITASARVLFNTAAPQDAAAITQTLDAVAPKTTLQAQRIGASGNDYQVRWSSLDDAGGSGVRHATVYVAEDGGDFKIWLRQTNETSGIYQGRDGHTYEFLALATDNAGNRERPPPGALAPDDGSHANLGGLPTFETTPTDQPPPPPAEQPATNPLFVEAAKEVPNLAQSSRPSEYETVLSPFGAEAFATGIRPSFAEIGPLAILPMPDGSVLASGGTNRGELYRFDSDGGTAGTPLIRLDMPIYDLALDADGRLWATTGGGPLVELDPASGAILAEHGDGITQALAIDRASGKIYVAAGSGVEIFDPVTETFTHFSDTRVDDLAFSPSGELWGTSWPERGTLVQFTPLGRAQAMLRLDEDVDSLAFGVPGSTLAGLLFATTNGGDLVMVDTLTLHQVTIARGGSRGEAIQTTADGALLVGQSSQIDRIAPLFAPRVIGTNPPDQGAAALPLVSLTVRFDQDMDAADPTRTGSVLNLANYSLTGTTAGAIQIRSATYDAATRTVTLRTDPLPADHFALHLSSGIASQLGATLPADYNTGFTTTADLTNQVRIDFLNTRSSRADATVSYDVRVTNIGEGDLLAPIVLALDPARYFQGQPLGTAGPNDLGLWLIELDETLADGALHPGESTLAHTVTVSDPLWQRVEIGHGVYAVPAPNAPPVFDSTPVTQAQAGQTYSYTALATDPGGGAVSYLLLNGPQGMSLDSATGLVTWTPTQASPEQAGVVLNAYDRSGAYATQSFAIQVSGVNRAPQFLTAPSQSEIAEGQTFELPLAATDADGDPLYFYADNLPGGAVIDAERQTLTWTPGFDAAGQYRGIAITVSDGRATDRITFDLTVLPVDQAPTLLAPPDRTVREGDPVRIQLQASDPDLPSPSGRGAGGEGLYYSSRFLPGGSFLDPNTGEFDWTPSYTQAGTYRIPFSVSDGTSVKSVTTTITVLNVNGAPVFDQLGEWQVREGQTLFFRAFAFDPENPSFVPPDRLPDGQLTPLLETDPTVSYVASGLPAGATFDPDTAMFSWTPGYTQAGTYAVSFTAADDGDGTGTPGLATVTVPITVINANQAPALPEIGNLTLDRGQVVELPVTATDADGNALALTASSLPGFATFIDQGDGTGLFRFAPGVTDRGNQVITLTATDNGDGGGPASALSSTRSFVVGVNVPNEVPQLADIGDVVAVSGERLSFTVRASDIEQNPLIFSVDALPAGATLTPQPVYGTALFEWTPGAADIGTHDVTLRVADDGNDGKGPIGSDTQTLRIVVRATNQAPVLQPVGDYTLTEGAPFVLHLAATDPDQDPLTYSAANLPAGASLDPRTGVLAWTPNLIQAGDYEGVVLTVSDGNRSDSETIALLVGNLNQAPILTPLADQSTRETAQLSFTLVANDFDGDPIAFGSANPLPAGARFDGRTGVFTWTPNYDQAGDYVLTFLAQDPDGARDTVDVTVRVDNLDRAPTLAVEKHQARIGEPFSLALTASDPDLAGAAADGESLSFSAKGLPDGATLDPTTGVLAWTPGVGQSGDYLVLVSVSDGRLSVTEPLVLRASVIPEAPTILIEQTPSFAAVPGQPVVVHVLASSFAPIASTTLTVNGEAVALDATGTARIKAAAPGKLELVATATDTDGLTSTVTGSLRVRDPLDSAAPVAVLDAALHSARLAAPTAIRATVTDSNLDAWVLELLPYSADSSAVTLSPGGRGQGEGGIQLATGSGSAANAVLATLDTGTIANGIYRLRLTASDMAGRVTTSEAMIEVAATAKPGQYIRSETDLSVTLGGVSLDLVRQYDSLAAGSPGSFGDGWRLTLRDLDVQTDVPLTGQEAAGAAGAFSLGTRVYLTLPTGERVGFTFTPQRHELPGLAYYTPAFTADPGVTWTLQADDTRLSLAGNRLFDLGTGLAYNPTLAVDGQSALLLTAPDGTGYRFDAAHGVTEIVASGGTRLTVSDSGIFAPDGTAVRFTTDSAGRLARIVSPDGEQLVYGYDAQGRLASVRQLSETQSTRYGYEADGAQRLDLITGANGLVVDYSGASPVTRPLAADLGGARAYLAAPYAGDLAAGTIDRIGFSVRPSELASTAGGAIYLGVLVEADQGSAFLPGVPQIQGLTPIASRSDGSSAFALYKLEPSAAGSGQGEGLLQLLSIAGADDQTAGTYRLSPFVAGDANRDTKVDGTDAALLAQARGKHVGEAGYLAAADANLDGQIDGTDNLLLFANLGYLPNQAPVINAPTLKTHVDLEISIPVADLVSDPEGDPTFLRVVGAEHGTATLSADARFVVFTPEAGYAGATTFAVSADDGMLPATSGSVSLAISNAPLLSLEFDHRRIFMEEQSRAPFIVVGDFADQSGVELPVSYVNAHTLDPNVATVGAGRAIVGLSNGTTVLVAERGALTAATAISVGEPEGIDALYAQLFNIDAYPDAIALQPGSNRQMVIQWGERHNVTSASAGTHYFSSNLDIVGVTPEGMLTAKTEGQASITVIFKSGEEVVPVRVLPSVSGTAPLGPEGGIMIGPDGHVLSVGPGGISGNATVRMSSLMQADLTTALPSVMDFVGALSVEIEGGQLKGPIQLAVPVDPAIPAGEIVYFLEEMSLALGEGGSQTRWVVTETGVVGADGYARTTSPPWPGLSARGNILIAQSHIPLRPVAFDFEYGLNPIVLEVPAYGIYAIAALGQSFAVAPLPLGITEVQAYRYSADKTLPAINIVDVGADTDRIIVDLPDLPTLVGTDLPSITGIEFAPDPMGLGKLTISADHLADAASPTIDGVNLGADPCDTRVVFELGASEIVVSGEQFLPETDSSHIVLDIPAGVFLGLSKIRVERPVGRYVTSEDGIAAQVDWVQSGSVRLDNPGGYGFIATGKDGILHVLDISGSDDPTTEQIVKQIDLRSRILDTVCTTDRTRVFAATDRGVAVIDGVSLQLGDVDPNLPGIDFITLPFSHTPTALVLDPREQFLYAAGQDSVLIIDVRVGSPTLHQVVDSVHSLGTPNGQIKGMALNVDGTRLYLTAPATTLFGGNNPWVDGGRDHGKIIVINVDEDDRPLPGQPNLNMWREKIATLDGDIEPSGINATPRADTMVFAAMLNVLEGFGRIVVTDNDPRSFKASVQFTRLDLSHSRKQPYQLDVRNARDIVVLPDMKYALVTDWHVPLTVAVENPEYIAEYVFTHELGAKVGLVKDPLGSPELVASTTPVKYAVASEIELSSDGNKAYVIYAGANDLVVINVPALIALAESRKGDPDLHRLPIDHEHFGGDFFLPAVPVPGLPRALSLQPVDPLVLISPRGTAPISQGVGPLQFDWSVDAALLGTEAFTSRLFVSTLPPGEGLWPFDPGVENAPVAVRSDNNPNRVWTSPAIVGGQTQYAIPATLREALTAGQRYYWGVEVDAGGRIYRKAAEFLAEPMTLGAPYNGVTIITHGFQLGMSVGSGPFQQPAQFIDLGSKIAGASGGGVVLSYNKNTGEWIDRKTGKKGADAMEPGKAVVLVTDWYKESDISDSGFSEAAADAIFASLVDLNGQCDGALLESPLHFIGHSRGAVVNSEIIQRLGYSFPDVKHIIHMTTLDPHDQVQDSLNVPLNEIAASVLTSFGPLANYAPFEAFIKVSLDRALPWIARAGFAINPVPYADFLDPDVKTWANVGFADNYWQRVAIDDSDKGFTATPNGVSIASADIDLFLNGRAGFRVDDKILGLLELGLGGAHSRVWQWYAGTTDTGISEFASHPIFRRISDTGVPSRTFLGLSTDPFNSSPWYLWPDDPRDGAAGLGQMAGTRAVWEGIGSGWYFSSAGGGADNRPSGSGERVPVSEDNTEVTKGLEAVPSVFNGDFENGIRQSIGSLLLGTNAGRFPLSFELPGWSFHGGDGFSGKLSLNGAEYVDFDLTGLFAVETDVQSWAHTLVSKLWDVAADKLIKFAGNKIKEVPAAPGASSTAEYRQWYSENWGESSPNRIRFDAAEDAFRELDKLVNELEGAPLGDYLKLDGKEIHPFGIQALKDYIGAGISRILDTLLPKSSDYALMMGGGGVIRDVVQWFLPEGLEEFGQGIAASVVQFDSISHNRLMVPASARSLEFEILAPFSVVADAGMRVSFAPADANSKLAPVSSVVPLEGGFFSKHTYRVAVPEKYQGQIATVTFTSLRAEDTNVVVFDMNDIPGVIEDVASTISQLYFLDDIRFSAEDPEAMGAAESLSVDVTVGGVDLESTAAVDGVYNRGGAQELNDAETGGTVAVAADSISGRSEPGTLAVSLDPAVGNVLLVDVGASAPEEGVEGLRQSPGPQGSVSGGLAVAVGGALPGEVTVTEETRSVSRLSYSLTIPEGATALRFALPTVLLSDPAAALSDAFEVALLDSTSFESISGAAVGLSQTDAFLNLQADGRVFYAPGVAVSGCASSGDLVDLSERLVIDVGLTGAAVGRAVTLYFDLLGFGDPDSQVTIDGLEWIYGGNSAPTAAADLIALDEDSAALFDVRANDADAQDGPLTVELLSNPAQGTLAPQPDGTFIYQPSANFNGEDSFTYRLSDGTLQSEAATVRLVVQPINDAPVAQADFGTLAEDTVLDLDVLANDSDIDGNALSINGTDAPAHGQVAVLADGRLRYTPTADYFGADRFTYRVTDSQGGEATAEVVLTVTPVADAPRALNDLVLLEEDGSARFDVRTNDLDPDGRPMTLERLSDPAHGTLALQSDGSFLYQPAADFFGDDSFTYRMSDGALQSAAATVTLRVAAVNDAPRVTVQRFVTAEDQRLTALLTATDPEGDPLTFTLDTGPAHGVLQLGTDGGFQFTPAAGFSGDDGFTFNVSDGQAVTSARAEIRVSGVNHAPVAADDSIQVDENSATRFDPLLNDSDPDGDPLVLQLLSNPAHGVLSPQTDGTFLYQPTVNFNGQDSFTYRLSDGSLSSGEATVRLDVVAVNYAPVAHDDTATLAEDGTLEIAVLANDTDSDGDALALVAVGTPQNGQAVALADGRVRYTPRPDYFGSDSFTYTVADPSGARSVASVSVQVTPVPDAPTTSTQCFTSLEDVTLSERLTATNVDGAALAFAVQQAPAHGQLSLAGDGTFQYLPGPDFNGADSFTFTVSNTGGSAVGRAELTITGVNDAPVARADLFALDEDGSLSGNVTANDTDSEADPITVELVSGAAHGVLVLQPDGAFSYQPAANFAGEDSFTYTASDGRLKSAPALVRLVVRPVNDAPVALDDARTIAEDQSIDLDVRANDSDIDGDALTVVSVGTPSHGQVTTLSDGRLHYVPAADYNGQDSFTYVIADPAGAQAQAEVRLQILPVNDAPRVTVQTFEVLENGSLTGRLTATDPDGDALGFNPAQGTAHGAVTLNFDGHFLFTPVALYAGTDSFTFTVTDGQASSTGRTDIRITAINNPPQAADDTAELAEDGSVLVDVRANDTDPDGDALSLTAVSVPEHGTASIESGRVRYTPSANFFGADSFAYTIGDGQATSTATVTVKVNPVNDAPSASNDTAAVDEDGSALIAVLANDTDIEGDALRLVSLSAPAHGTAVIENGAVRYTPAANYFGADGFTYVVTDNKDSRTAAVTLTVRPIDDPPIARDDAAATDEDRSVLIAVLANDSDVDGVGLAIDSFTAASHGTVAVEGGALRYTPAANWHGSDGFTYTLRDGKGRIAGASAVVEVASLNDAPLAVADAAATLANQPVDIPVLANDSDVEGDPLAIDSVTAPAHGTAEVVGGLIRYTPATSFSGDDSFTYRASDGQGGFATAGVSVRVGSVNHAPVAVDDSATTAEDQSVVISVLANDSDIDGDSLSVVLESGPTHGALVLGTDGRVTYTPTADFAGSDGFTYHVYDGSLGSNVATVSVIVTPVNDAPVVVGDVVTTAEDAAVTFDVRTNDIDIEGDALAVTLVGDPSHGSVVVRADGRLTYTPVANYFGADSFTYRVNDGALDSNVATVAVTVTTVNDAPVLVPVVDQRVDEGSTLTLVVAASDLDGDALTFSIDSGPSGAQIDAHTGTFTWKPLDGPAAEPVTVRVTDSAGAWANTSFGIQAGNVAPSLSVSGPANARGGETYSLLLSATDPGSDRITSWAINWGDGTSESVAATQTAIDHVFAAAGGLFTIQASATDEDGTYQAAPVVVNVAAKQSPLTVTRLDPNESGFHVQFSGPFDVGSINVYDANSRLGSSDVVVTGATRGAVSGSVIFDSDGAGLTFVKTGGALSPDRYSVTLVSATAGFHDALGALDGDGNGVAGGNFVAQFDVGQPAAVALSLPDFMRGPGQTVDLQATTTGLPVTLASKGGVKRVEFTVQSDPTMLLLSGATAGAGLPAGATLTSEVLEPGRLRVTVESATALPTGSLGLVNLVAQVPFGAPYGASEAVRISEVTVNGTTQGQGDTAVHLVGYFGDTDGSRGYSNDDGQLVQRVVVRSDTGFAAYPGIDPLIVADINASGSLTSIDASRIYQEIGFLTGVAATDRAEIPPIPVNHAPSFGVLPSTSVARGSTLALFVIGTDTDPGDVLSYSLDAAPLGAQIDSSTGALTWTPGPGSADVEIRVKATDAGGLSALGILSVIVQDAPALSEAQTRVALRLARAVTGAAASPAAVGVADPSADGITGALQAPRLEGNPLSTAPGLAPRYSATAGCVAAERVNQAVGLVPDLTSHARADASAIGSQRTLRQSIAEWVDQLIGPFSAGTSAEPPVAKPFVTDDGALGTAHPLSQTGVGAPQAKDAGANPSALPISNEVASRSALKLRIDRLKGGAESTQEEAELTPIDWLVLPTDVRVRRVASDDWRALFVSDYEQLDPAANPNAHIRLEIPVQEQAGA